MKVRGTIPGTPLSAKLTALCWGALILLVPVAVSACTSSTSTTPPTIISPTVTSGGASFASTPSSATTASPDTSTPSPPTSPATAQVTVTQTITVPPSTIPPVAPVTGGGGTAGFQDSLLLALGAAAILAGAGGLVYRRWTGRGP